MVKRASRGEKLDGLTDMPAKVPACQSTPPENHSRKCLQVIVKPIYHRPSTKKKDEKVDGNQTQTQTSIRPMDGLTGTKAAF